MNRIPAKLLMAVAALLVACPYAIAQTNPVSVLWTDPIDGGPLVNRSATLQIQFNQAMDWTTLNSNNVQVVSSVSGAVDCLYFYSGTSFALTVDPLSDFVGNEVITVTVTVGVRGLNGSQIAAPFVFTFRTRPASVTPIPVGGTLSVNTNWTAGNVYQVTSDLTVPFGVQLTIDPGVVVKLNSGRRITVQGTMVLNSTASQKVVFTSYRDDQYGGDNNGDGNSVGATGDWTCLRFENPANVFHDAVVRFGGNGSNPMFWIAGSSAGTMQVRNSIFENALDKGIRADSSAAAWIHDNIVRFNGKGVDMAATAGVLLENNLIGWNTWAIYVTSGNPTVQNNNIKGNGYPIYWAGGIPQYSGNTVASNTNSAIAVGGTLGQDTTWGNVQGLGLPFLVTSDFTVPSGRTLTIDGGVVVKFQAVDTGGTYTWSYRNDLVVNGTLNLLSTAGQKVVFTSSRDDDYGGDSDGAGGSPAPGNWGAIKYSNPTNVLHDAIIRYGGLGSTYTEYPADDIRPYDAQMIWASGAAGSLEIQSCVIERAYDKAIFAEANQTPWVHNNTIRNCSTGVAGTTATVDDNILSNLVTAVSLSGDAPVERNTITGCGTGIQVAGGNIRNNVINGCSSLGIVVTGTGAPVIASNSISNCGFTLNQGGSAPVYSANTFVGNTNSAIAVGGTLGQDTTWGNVQGLGLPFLVTSDFTVPSGRTLTIDGGVVVKFQAVDTGGTYTWSYRNDLVVNGTLNLLSTAGQKVVFTSSRDDDYGGDSDGAGGSPAPGNWGAIKYSNPTNVLHDAIIRYGGLGSTYTEYPADDIRPYDAQMIWASGAAGSLEIQSCVIERAYDKAIFAEANQTPWVHNNTIRNCSTGVAGTTATVDDNILSNLVTAVSLSGDAPVERNTITGCGTGIQVAGGNIRNNVINGCSSLGIVVTGTGAPVIASNSISNCGFTLNQGGSAPVYSANTFVGNTNSAIAVGGTLGQDTTWGNVQGLGLPFLVTSDFTVPSGRTLTIDGGVVVKFQAVDTGGTYTWSYRNDLVVNGTLNLLSTAGQKVVFTSSRDDDYGGDSDGAGGSPAPGNWGAIKYSNPTNVLHDAIIRYGGLGSTYTEYPADDIRPYDAQMIWASGAAGSLEIQSCVIERAYDKAIFAEANQTPWVHNNTIRICKTGIALSGGGAIAQNIINHNSSYAVSLSGGHTALSANNFISNAVPVYQGVGSAAFTNNIYQSNINETVQVEGSLAQNTMWSDPGIPILVLSDVTIPQGRTLTIMPGATIKFQYQSSASSKRRIYADGQLLAQGTVASPIIFTSAQTTPAAGDWGYVYVNEPGTILENCQFWYGGQRSDGNYMLWIAGPNIFVRRCEFHYAYSAGVYVNVGTSVTDPRIGISGCLFDYCPTGIDYTGAPTVNSVANFLGNYFSHSATAIYIRNVGSTLQASYNQFVGVTSYGIQNTDTVRTVNGQNNWWGDATGPSGQGAGSGVPVSQYVNFSNWLSEPVSQAQGIFNVIAQRRSGSMLVDIYYDLLGDAGQTYDVNVVVTTTGGEPYTIDPAAGTLSGSVGSGVSPGENQQIVWNAGAEAGPHYTDKMRIKVIADLE